MSAEGSTRVKSLKDKHARGILAALNGNRTNRFLCDGVVIIGEDRLHVQKAVLSAASHYFRLNFSYEGPDGNPRSEVDLTSLAIKMDTFETILDYIYTSEIQLSEENIQDILQAADVLLLDRLKDICCEYLEECITPENCLGIMDFAARFTCPWLLLKITQYVDENFRYIYKTEEFMKLDEMAVTKLLSRFTLTATDDNILESILLWYNFNKAERDGKVDGILRTCFKGVTWPEEVFCGRDFEEKMPELTQQCDFADLPSRGSTEVILIAGGTDEKGQVLNLVRYVNPKEFRYQQIPNTKISWKDLKPMNSKRSGHGLVECGGCVYAIGGINTNGDTLRAGEKYSPHTNTWAPIANMGQGRAEFGLVAIKENIYAIGGVDKARCLLTLVEAYNIFENKWRRLPVMNIEHHWFACVALNKTIFVIGGGLSLRPFDNVECFDTETETWYSVSPLLEKRYFAKAVAEADEIFVFGGQRKIECPSAMMHGGGMKFCGNERYSVSTDSWTPIQQKPGLEGCLCVNPDLSRLDTALSVGDYFYVLGKLQIDHFMNAIRGYDRRINTWFTAVPNFPNNQEPLTACAVKIPNYILK